MLRRKFCWGAAALGCCAILSFSGCATPPPQPVPPGPVAVPIDEDPMTALVRTVASQMCPNILAIPELAQGGVSVIKLAEFKNSSRFFIDRNIFMNRLRLELNRYSQGRVRFLIGNEKVLGARKEILVDRQEKKIKSSLEKVAAELAASPVANQPKPIKVAVIPVFNTNLVNMNADSFAAMLRSYAVNAAGGRIQFLMPGVVEGADYYLTGQFIAESMKSEGIINLAKYIEVIDARVKAGKSMYIAAEPSANGAANKTINAQGNVQINGSVAAGDAVLYDSYLKNILANSAMYAKPNVNKLFNIMLIDAKSKVSVFEKMITLDNKITDNSGAANYILSGEISGIHGRTNGDSSDYLLVSVNLVDPESATMLWEDACEVRWRTKGSPVYK